MAQPLIHVKSFGHVLAGNSNVAAMFVTFFLSCPACNVYIYQFVGGHLEPHRSPHQCFWTTYVCRWSLLYFWIVTEMKFGFFYFLNFCKNQMQFVVESSNNRKLNFLDLTICVDHFFISTGNSLSRTSWFIALLNNSIVTNGCCFII